MNIYLTDQDIRKLIGAIIAIAAGIYLVFNQQEAAKYFINAFLG